MSWRYLPPAYSPVSMDALAGGLNALVTGAPEGLDRWLALRYQVDAALLVDSGTSALRLAIESVATPSAPRVRVALPAYGCYDLATAAIGAGAAVSFYDVDPDTLGPDWSSLAAALAAGADALVLVHQYGIPVDIDRARALADAHGAIVIEDAAQGVGGWWRHRRLGASGDLGILSFGRGKGMTAGGGGALLASGPKGQELLEGRRGRLAPAGRGIGSVLKLAAQALLSHPMAYGVPARVPWLALGDTPFHEPWAPRGLDAACAGALRAAAELAHEEAGTRRRVAGSLTAELQQVPSLSLVQAPSGEGMLPGWLRFPVILNDASRAKAASSNLRHLGVAPGYPMPLPELPALRAGAKSAQWPGATRLASQLVTLPSHRWVTLGDVACLRSALQSPST
jgi:perosamine synthetase